MPSRFDEIIPRGGTGSVKHDDLLNRFGRTGIQPMWVADMDFRVPECVRAALAALVEHGVFGYHLITQGCYRAIIEWFGRRHGYRVEPSSILFVPGVISALACLVQALTRPGDGIIIQPPVYHPFFSVIRGSNRTLRENRLIEEGGRYSIDYDDLDRQAAGAKVLLLCSPHNPVGRVWTRPELERVAEICLRHRLLIISDEIHNDLVFAPHRHIPTASLAPEVDRITVTCHAPSKTFNFPALETAYMLIGEEERRKCVAQVLQGLHIDRPNVFGLCAMEAAYTEGEPWLAELLGYLEGNRAWFSEHLARELPRIGLSPLEGTYLLWLDFRRYGLSHDLLRERVLDRAGLALNDGAMFGAGGEGFQRMNIGCPRALIAQAFDRLKAAFGDGRP